MNRIIKFSVKFALLFTFLGISNVEAQVKDWELEHYELSRLVQLQWNEPTGDAMKIFEENLRWLEVKAEVRDRVEASLNELNKLHLDNPENGEFAKWVQKYFELLENAELSGENTVRNTIMWFLSTEDRYSSIYWDQALARVHEYGRRLFIKTKETRFDTFLIIDRAKCLLNFAVGDVEDNPYGFGLYLNRKLVFGYEDEEGYMNLPDRDFYVFCERRGEFELDQEGEPWLPADLGFAYVNLIREECLWWEFNDQYNDATDLMNQYYEDVLCKEPPHGYEMGHKWFLDLAEEYALEKSKEYNEGFYGTVEGIVEIVDGNDRKPAAGAKVTIRDWGQEWTTTADHDGMYKIEVANLHADCSPFDIYATHEGDRTDDTYNGYLTEPDRSARLLKDLEIERTLDWEWSGTLTVEKLERFDCELDMSKSGKNKSIWTTHDLTTTRATVNIKAENIDDSPPAFNINMGENLIVSGFMKCDLRHYESTATSVETLTGEDITSLDHDNLNLMFMANIGEVQKDGSLEEMTKMLESGNIDEAKLEDFGKKLEESMGTGDEGTSKITVIMVLFGDCNCKAIITQKGWREENGEKKTYNESTALDMPIGGGVAQDFTADYVRKKDGSATITGNFSKIRLIEGGQSEGCPPREETINCTLNLSKRPKK